MSVALLTAGATSIHEKRSITAQEALQYMKQAKTFSTQAGPNPKSKDPADRLIYLAAKWRRERNLDDSYDNLRASALAVMKANPKLAQAYKMRPTTMAQARANEDPWKDLHYDGDQDEDEGAGE